MKTQNKVFLALAGTIMIIVVVFVFIMPGQGSSNTTSSTKTTGNATNWNINQLSIAKQITSLGYKSVGKYPGHPGDGKYGIAPDGWGVSLGVDTVFNLNGPGNFRETTIYHIVDIDKFNKSSDNGIFVSPNKGTLRNGDWAILVLGDYGYEHSILTNLSQIPAPLSD